MLLRRTVIPAALCAAASSRAFSITSVSLSGFQQPTNDEGIDPLADMLSMPGVLATDPPSRQPASGAQQESGTHDQHETHSNASDSQFSPPTTMRVKLHNLPKNWMHEEIIRFVEEVAEHAGVPPPYIDPESDAEAAEAPSGSAIPQRHSPYVAQVKVFFGRRTGLVYGCPELLVRPASLGKYLVKDLQFEPGDFRARMHFSALPSEERSETGVDSNNVPRQRTVTSFEDIEESVDQEQQDALSTLELDRYLLAPDLLYDIARMNQRRLLTSNEQIIVDSFLDSPDEENPGADDPYRRPSRSRARSKTAVRKRKAKEQAQAGRGSSINTHIPKPYVQGRSL